MNVRYGMAIAVLLGAPLAAAETLTVAAFNIAWAGTAADFAKHVEVCSAPKVNWCDTRPRVPRGASVAPESELARAEACQAATIEAAGGRAASMQIAPCNAYRPAAAPQGESMAARVAASREPVAYALKMQALQTTVSRLIERDKVQVIAFQEVKSEAVIRELLGMRQADFDVCIARHDAFQSLGFAWRRNASEKPGVCATASELAILDPPDDPMAFRRVRPGLQLTLMIGGAPLVLMNVHLKAGCANIVPTDRYAARLLDDPAPACQVFNRQVPHFEAWLEKVIKDSPRVVILGDFNRRIDEEANAKVAKSAVRSDQSDPASAHQLLPDGRNTARYFWPEIDDGSPRLFQIPLAGTDKDCKGFVGLDHVVISDALHQKNGMATSRKVAVESIKDAVLEGSDHCPRVAQLRL
jgi:endonuclease/exonuclease/phosphatase family metal-dependent hydrolase